ncbi:MAG: lipopolysaccharide biosynthesis protein [Gemmatimonadota bacterium]
MKNRLRGRLASGHEDAPLLKRYARNFSIGLGGSLASLVLGLGRTALLTKSLSIADYGKILIVMNLPAFIGTILNVRVQDLINKFYPEFEAAEDAAALRGLLLLSIGLNLAVSLVVSLGIFLLAPWIADRFYDDPGLAILFRIYAVIRVLSFLHGVYTPILRLKDRFAAVIIPQVIGNGLTLAALAAYFLTVDGYRLTHVVAILAAGLLASTLPPLVAMLRIVRPHLIAGRAERARAALGRHGRMIRETLFHTNLAGYLNIVFTPGDVFLLGLFGTPTQVAIYGLAQQLTAPLLVLQDNIAAALTPEVVSLWARRKLEQLNRLLRLYLIPMALGGALALLAGWLLARPVILWLAKPEYLAAIPVFHLQLVVLWISVVFLIFYPLGLSLNMLRWFNGANAIVLVLVAGYLVWQGELTALAMAWLLLLAAVIRRLLGNLPVYFAFRRELGAQRRAAAEAAGVAP